MSRNAFSLTAAAMLVFGASAVSAATPVDLRANSLPLLKQINASKGLTASSKRDGLKVLSNRQDFNKTYHQRLQQMYQGVPVVGGYAIVHSKASKGLMAASKAKVNGRIYQDIASDLGARPVQAKADAALDTQLAKYKGQKISEKHSELVVYVDKKDKAHWAYKVSFMAESMKNIPAKPSAIVDAKTLTAYVEWNDIKTVIHDAKAIGFGGNKRVGIYEYGVDLPKLEISREDTLAECYMENTDVKVVDMDGQYSSDNSPMSFPCSEEITSNTFKTGHHSDGYDEINGAYSPTDDALYAGYVIKHMYRDWYDLQVLKNHDGSPMQLVMRVHYGQRYENAYWDGRQMTFGDGGSWMYPLVSLGVGAHEISHGFTEQNSNLQYYGQSGGMNESFSDMAAQAAEYYSDGDNSWKIGERIMKESSGYDALRYMDTPSRDGRSIDSADDYYDGLDVHYSSGVYNRLYYLMATSEGWTARMAFDVMVKANQDYWTPYASFNSGGCGVLAATMDYEEQDANYDAESVQDALSKVGIDTSRCDI